LWLILYIYRCDDLIEMSVVPCRRKHWQMHFSLKSTFYFSYLSWSSGQRSTEKMILMSMIKKSNKCLRLYLLLCCVSYQHSCSVIIHDTIHLCNLMSSVINKLLMIRQQWCIAPHQCSTIIEKRKSEKCQMWSRQYFVSRFFLTQKFNSDKFLKLNKMLLFINTR